MSISTYSFSVPSSWTSELDFESNQNHNEWNEFMNVFVHIECSLWLQRCLCEGELCIMVFSSLFAMDTLTDGNGTR